MNERPILFSSEMIRALLEGRKSQTRRIVQPQPEQNGAEGGMVLREGYKHGEHNCERYEKDKNPYFIWKHPKLEAGYCHTNREAMERLMIPLCPHGAPGDRLWVREMLHRPDGDPWLYEADNQPVMVSKEDETAMLVWAHHKEQNYCPSIHMPRWASRITLELTAVRVERLQEISEGDAKAEGAMFHDGRPVGHHGWRHDYSDVYATAKHSYCALWEKINGKGCWALNPFVWVETFKVIGECK